MYSNCGNRFHDVVSQVVFKKMWSIAWKCNLVFVKCIAFLIVYSKLRTKHGIPGQFISLEILFFSTSLL